MLYKNVIAITALLLCSNMLWAQSKQKVEIESATVFLKGAELTSKTKVSLGAGETEILFTNVAGNVNQQSLTIGASNGVVV